MTIPTDAEKEKESQSARREVDGNKKTIIIYSPDLNFCFSLSMLFQDRYNVITTTNLGMLEQFVESYAADLVMIDAVPSESIIERLGRLKRTKKNLPVFILYVYNSKDVKLDRAIRDHVDSVFYKPFEISTISRRINELLMD